MFLFSSTYFISDGKTQSGGGSFSALENKDLHPVLRRNDKILILGREGVLKIFLKLNIF